MVRTSCGVSASAFITRWLTRPYQVIIEEESLSRDTFRSTSPARQALLSMSTAPSRIAERSGRQPGRGPRQARAGAARQCLSSDHGRARTDRGRTRPAPRSVHVGSGTGGALPESAARTDRARAAALSAWTAGAAAVEENAISGCLFAADFGRSSRLAGVSNRFGCRRVSHQARGRTRTGSRSDFGVFHVMVRHAYVAVTQPGSTTASPLRRSTRATGG